MITQKKAIEMKSIIDIQISDYKSKIKQWLSFLSSADDSVPALPVPRTKSSEDLVPGTDTGGGKQSAFPPRSGPSDGF